MEQKIKKIFNYRPLLLILISFIVGIILSYFYLQEKYLKIFNFALLAFFFILTIALIIILLYLLRNKISFRFTKKLFSKFLVVFISICVSFGIGSIYISNCGNMQTFNNEVAISANVTNINESSFYYSVDVSNLKVVFDGETYNLKSGAKIIINFDSNNFIDINLNDELLIYSTITLNQIYVNMNNLGAYINGRAYTIVCDTSNVAVTKNNQTFSQIVRNDAKELLVNNMGSTNGELAYSMLFGDKDSLDDKIYDMFSMSGIVHILAVSGLHIGVIAGALVWLMKKLKVNKYVTFAVLFIFLFLYNYLCGFPFSAIRASIMYLIMFGAFILGKEYDALNSWSFAGLVILLIFPVALFDVGFQLSMLCILGIITVAPILTEFFEKKLKFPKFLAGSFAVSISTNILILPVCANIFNRVSIISIFANIFVLPIFSVLFVILFTLTFLALIFKFLSFALIIPQFLIHIIKTVADFFASIPFAYINIFRVGYIILFLIGLTAIFGRFALNLGKMKTIICSFLIGVAVIIVIFSNLSINFNGNYLYSSFQYTTNNIILVQENNEANLIGLNYYLNSKTDLNNLKIIKINSIIAYDFDARAIEKINSFIDRYFVTKIYIPNKFANVKNLINCSVGFLDNKITIDKFTISTIYNDSNLFLGVDILSNNKHYVLMESGLTNANLNYFLFSLDFDIEVFYVNNLEKDIKNYIDYNVKNLCFHKNSKFKTENNFNLYEIGNFTYKI